MQIGSAIANAGELATGFLEVAELPTGIIEQIPVVIANGARPGPELWITAAIHGNEANGLAVAHDLMNSLRPDGLRGTVVCIPNLNPAGLRQNVRGSYYSNEDPNRCFPEPDPDDETPPNMQEQINQRIFETFAESADALIDLHTASVGAIPFNIRHRVTFGRQRSESAARTLANEQKRLMEAFGLPIVNHYHNYLAQEYHRTVTGAALNYADIPAMTVELGEHRVINDDFVGAGVAGCYRVMQAMDMLDATPASVEDNDTGVGAPVDFPVRRTNGPFANKSGIIRHHVERGEAFEAEEQLATITSIHGKPKATIHANRDGYLLFRRTGAAVYENEPIGSAVIRDESDIVIPVTGGT